MARSRYAGNEVVDGYFYGTWKNRALSANAEPDMLDGVRTFEHVVQRGERLDHLAARFLGDDEYMWVIALVNGINFPLGVEPGRILKIPLDVRDILNKLQKG